MTTAHPEPHSMNGSFYPDSPPSCDCECARCYVARGGLCLCRDCKDEHHDHSARAKPAEEQSS